MQNDYKVTKLACSKFDPEREQEHAPARWLMRWTKDPFKKYPWAFCEDCAELVAEKSGAEIITELHV